jgi:dienelactone hydrolase/ketosteroid isomerase-like protein
MNVVTPSRAGSQPYLDKIFDVELETDVAYGVGGVGYDDKTGPARHRALKLDIYRPRASTEELRPALIMAFGGAFHRGSKSVEVFEGENSSTAVAEYCREFARRGYVCFSIDYRLMQEDPDPGVTPFLLPNQPQNRDRIDYVRGLLGLPRSTPQMMANTLEAATDDMSTAIAFVRSRSKAFGVDISRIAIGGFSAGAAIAMNSAFAERSPVAAVVALSGRMARQTLETYVLPDTDQPAALLYFGENDLPGIRDGLEEMREFMTGAGIDNEFVTVPGANHFYLRTAAVPRLDASVTDVETLMAEFLHRCLGLSPLKNTMVADEGSAMTVERLHAFSEAWNRHDIETLMSFMTDDCMFDANAGSQATGTTFRGKQEVRRGFIQAWRDYPDARWNNPREFVTGNRGVAEWVFTGPDLSGNKVEVAGCDLFVFRGDKILVKNSFRKRPI